MSDRLALALAELVDALRAEAAADARPPDVERLLSIPEAARAMGGIGRTLVYRELAAGRLRSIHVGRRVLIPAGALADYAASATTQAAGGPVVGGVDRVPPAGAPSSGRRPAGSRGR